MNLLLESLFFIIPTYASNSCASLSLVIPKLKDWKSPIDFGHSWRGERILGKGKTFRGLIFGTICAIPAGFLQYYLAKHITFTYLSFFGSASLSKVLILAVLMGFGGLIGDIVKSFFKRRVGIKSGRPWPVFDQLDFIVGGILFGALIFFPPWKVVLTLVIVTPIAHLAANITAYFLKIKEVWW